PSLLVEHIVHPRAMHAQKNFLHYIFGVMRIAQNAVGHLEDEAAMLADHGFDGCELVRAFEHSTCPLPAKCGACGLRCHSNRCTFPFSFAKTCGRAEVFGNIFGAGRRASAARIKRPMLSDSTPSAAVQQEPVPMLDLTRQYESIRDDVHAALERVLTTQHFIGGAELDSFERESAEYLGVRASVGCNSGTDALWLALLAAGAGPDTSVVTTPFTFFASVSSVVRCGATPVLADI